MFSKKIIFITKNLYLFEDRLVKNSYVLKQILYFDASIRLHQSIDKKGNSKNLMETVYDSSF